jgi:hypothetical protein
MALDCLCLFGFGCFRENDCVNESLVVLSCNHLGRDLLIFLGLE